MSTTVSVSGTSFSVPSEGDSNWGTDVTNLLIRLSDSSKVLQNTTTTFTLQNELNLGATYGLKLPYIKSTAVNPASSGLIRLGNAESVKWRNAANSADLDLTVNASNVLQFGGVTLALAGNASIVNADISPSAAIAYSKLNLASSIVNADVSASAAIAYSKLNLATSIVNADISASASIAYSKLNLATSIVNADIAPSAAIALSKLAALTVSRVVQTNSSTGVLEASSVTNTELGYLSGVTSSLQTQLNSTVTLTGTQTLTNKTLTSPVINSPTGIVKADVGLSNVDNTSDATKNSASVVLTNKDFDGGTASNTSRLTLPKNTKSSLDGLTRKAGTIAYATDTGKPYYDDGTTLKVIGSGSGGGINLITDGDAEGSNPFTAYKDSATASPVDGTGGTPSFVSIAISSSTPLSGTNSFVITKTFGNPIGEGVSVPFTVQPAYKARMLKISFDYFASTGFEPPYSTFNSDITVWIYDVTAGRLIQPSNFQITSRDLNSTFQADFQSDSASTDYRLILHCGTVNTAAWTFKADNFTVAPSQYVYAPAITDWIDYTPTISAQSGSLTNYTLSNTQWSRVGSNLYIKGKLTFTGAVGTWTFPVVSFPSGVSADTTSPVTAYNSKVTYTDTGVNGYGGDSLPFGTTGVTLAANRGTNGANIAITQAAPFAWGSTDVIEWTVGPIKIAGWTSNQQVSDGYDARDLKVNVLRSTNLTGLNPNNTSIKIPIAPTTIEDTYSGWDATNNRVLIKSAKSYDISYGAWIESTNVVTGQYYIVQLMKNGIEIDSSVMQLTSAAAQFMRLPGGKKGVTAVATDYFEVFLYSSANHSSSTLTARRVWLDVKADSSNSTISKGTLVFENYTNGAGTAITNASENVVPFATIAYSTHGAWDTATSTFKAPQVGLVAITGLVTFTGMTAGTGACYLVYYKNGNFLKRGQQTAISTASQSMIVNFEDFAVFGDTYQIKVLHTNGTTRNLESATTSNYIQIKMV